MRLYLMRHPETEANAKGLIYGKKDYPYTELGERQLNEAVKHIGMFPVTEIYSSPIGRAALLAEAVATSVSLTVTFDSRLEEMHQGILEGLSSDEAKERYPDVYENLMSGSMDFGPPDGESYRQFQERIETFLDELISDMESGETQENDSGDVSASGSDSGDRRVLIVSHGGVIRTMIESLVDCEPGFSWQLDVGNGSVIELNLEREYGRVRTVINIEL